jgi:hypothetical protein
MRIIINKYTYARVCIRFNNILTMPAGWSDKSKANIRSKTDPKLIKTLQAHAISRV